MMNAKLNTLVHSRWFERTILAVIVLAGVLAGLETSAALLERHGALLAWLDRLVLTIFILELVLKLAAHDRHPWNYFRDGWNVFDFTIVALCCLPTAGPFAAVLRLVRVLRLARLLTAVPKLQLLVGALLKSLSAMGYVGLLLALVFYIYGVAGVHLFSKGAPETFGSLPAALLSLFKIITLDNWSDLLASAQRGGPAAATAYFVSFILFGTMIMLNLFIGIIMNSMSEMHAEIERRDHARQVKELGHGTFADELEQMEQQIDALKAQTVKLKTHLTREPERGEKNT